MAFCLLQLEQTSNGYLLLEEGGGYLVLDGECQETGGGHMHAYGRIPSWWEHWKKEEDRRYRMRKSTKERIAELFASSSMPPRRDD